ncbi:MULTISPECIES: bifunctional metallophosphatase/5'-nucleotidase [Thiorhodovibrio]|uniref:bifunctional metallophosphatase/5'-nucleotidase n=1 Tax=Thiorhodovibrio TaxID=61593 RepID=UPI0019113387|nr:MULTISPECIES: bifunctional UDP-sugar hydrolase/5'-nucleotidase [Thiorhodovibrio]MBK5968504.1 multifunctional 2',3'-cyclic-nucleotide 2'-phosphodiesterase/5'-nucleotidase/3'-nucleotidase [Thiorhodovibrio winogradskyi]
MPRHLIIALIVALTLAARPTWADEALPLTILHFNDFHGQLDPVDDPTGDGASRKQLGGIARLAWLVQSIRAEEPTRPVILLFGGDLLQGTVTSTIFLGAPDIEFLTDMGVDAAVMGNHELDYGQAVFRERLDTAGFPILAANLDASPVPFPTPATVVLHPAGGPRIGILGLVTEELTTTTHPRNTSGIRMMPPADIAAGWLPWLRARADLVVVLSHLGLKADRQLAHSVPGIDLIVGGHNHRLLRQPEIEHGVAIVQAGSRGQYLGRMDLVVQDGQIDIQDYRVIPVDNSIPEDARIATGVAELNARLAEEIEVVVGHNAQVLDASRAVIRRTESNFGDWVGDLARALTGADVALFNAGTFRASLPAGEVRIRDIHEAFPFGNELVTATLSGATLQQVLNRSAALDPQDDPGGFLQVSGIRLVIADGQAQSVQVGGEPLDITAKYRLVMPDFLAAGGDGYAELKDLSDATATGRLVLDMVTEAFRQQDTLNAGVDGRLLRR